MRYVIIILGLLLVVGTLGGLKAAQIGTLIAFGEAAEKAGPPPETVSSTEAKTAAWEQGVAAVGTITAARGVSVNNDAAGVVTRIRFDSGDAVEEGDVLLELDTSVERAQLASASARRDLAKKNLERTDALLKEQVSTPQQRDRDAADLRAASADVALLRAQIARKVIRAPFAGRLGIRRVNLGQYLNPGTTVTDLQAADVVFVDFTLPQGQTVASGMTVRVRVEGMEKPEEREGQVSALDSRVDAGTRNRTIRATVPNEDDQLKPGMFARVELMKKKPRQVVMVPSTSVVHASYGDSVFVIEKPKGPTTSFQGQLFQVVRQQFVQLGESRGDFVEVTKGVKAGEKLVRDGAFKLRQGARVVINNTVKTDPKLAPSPPNH